MQVSEDGTVTLRCVVRLTMDRAVAWEQRLSGEVEEEDCIISCAYISSTGNDLLSFRITVHVGICPTVFLKLVCGW